MTQYYVYVTKSQNKTDLKLVSNVAEFALYHFNPNDSEFTGIVIEAPNAEAAYEIYNNPTCEKGQYFTCEEPTDTAAIKEQHNKLEASIKKIESLTQDVQLKTNAIQLMTCILTLNKIVINLTKDIKDKYKFPHSYEEIYNELMKSIILELSQYKYGKTK